jgi:hypothetical protein
MRRLYLKIYLTIIASLLLVVLVAGGVWRWGTGGPPGRRCSRSRARSQAWRCRLRTHRSRAAARHRPLAQRFRSELALYTLDGTLLAAAGRPLPPPPMNSDWRMAARAGRTGLGVPLPDDRRLVVRALPRHRNPLIGFLLVSAASRSRLRSAPIRSCAG